MQFNTSPNAMKIITCSMDIVQCIIIYVFRCCSNGRAGILMVFLETYYFLHVCPCLSPHYLGLPGRKTSLQWGLQALLMNEESELGFFLVDRLRHCSTVQVPVLKNVWGCEILKLPGLCEVWCGYRSGRWASVGCLGDSWLNPHGYL